MNQFPAMEEFSRRFSTAVERSGKKQEYLEKWGLGSVDEGLDLFRRNVQGGYDSHRHAMLSAPVEGTVLNIGPGMGFCVFLLAELFPSVMVAEPDAGNCRLLESIAGHYITGGGTVAADSVQVIHAGFAITAEATQYWQAKQELLKRRNRQGSILNFDISGAAELPAVLRSQADRIYFHKVLSSFSISNSFGDVLNQAAGCLSPKGVITWAEPDYIFSDIVAGGEDGQLQPAIQQAMERSGLDFKTELYPVTETASQPPVREHWTLIEAWRT
jgi:hypothetical protein